MVLFYFRREIFQQLVFQTILFALMVCFQHFQPCHINIQIHLFFNQRIASTQSFDFSIRKSLLIHIITGTNRRFTGHNLTDKFLLIFQCLIQIGIKSTLCNILINLNLLIFVTLTNNTSVSLSHV